MNASAATPSPRSAEGAPARLDDASVKLLAEDAKLAFVATIAEDGLPHLTLITSLQAKTPELLMFGQFCEGMSKTQMAANPEVAYLALDRDRRWIRGKARWRGTAKQGEDYEAFNRKPMFRYNAYFGIHTVHYLDVVEAEGPRVLRAGPLVLGAAAARLAALLPSAKGDTEALTPWSRRLLASPSSLKFLAWVGGDGRPSIVPAVTAVSRGGSVTLVPTFGRRELAGVPAGRHVALFAIDLEMRSVLLRGVFGAKRGARKLRAAGIEVDWVYNTMPPKHGQIYPALPLRAVRFAEATPVRA